MHNLSIFWKNSLNHLYFGSSFLACGGQKDGQQLLQLITTAAARHVCGLTKRDELSLRMVLALPKASIAGLASMIWSSKDPCKHRQHDIIKHGG